MGQSPLHLSLRLHHQHQTWLVCLWLWVRLWRPTCGALVHLWCQLHHRHLKHLTWLVCLWHHPQSMLWVRLWRPACGALVHLWCQLLPLHHHQTWLVCLWHHPQSMLWVRLWRPACGALVHQWCQLLPHHHPGPSICQVTPAPSSVGCAWLAVMD